MSTNPTNSRRSFLKKAGGVSLGVAGMSTMAAALPSERKEEKKETLLIKDISGTKDRMERVKIATVGMQR
ncbi:MAG TPA: twin-arginine translocation signal domain-containing protein, partial [Prolixibacteraceae bacterium]|nr:twin-arginine translocation signal domain-containing protein [Prolixibacteraceae bacterium]